MGLRIALFLAILMTAVLAMALLVLALDPPTTEHSRDCGVPDGAVLGFCEPVPVRMFASVVHDAKSAAARVAVPSESADEISDESRAA